MLALVDESTPESALGIHYVIAAAVLLDGDRRDDIRDRASKVIGHRPRPFHWKVEGALKRSAMIRLLGECDACVFAVIHHPVPSHRQALARSMALTDLTVLLSEEGVDELCIESRGPQDDEDRQTLIEADRLVRRPSPLHYDFAGKDEPLLWLADAAAGVVSEAECRKTDRWIAELQQAVSVIDVRRLERREPRLPS